MRYNSAKDISLMHRSAAGPLTRAKQMATINKGLPQVAFRNTISNQMMRRGGSLGCMDQALPMMDGFGCCLGELGTVAVPTGVRVGPIAARLIALRKQGVSPRAALLDAILRLHNQGISEITPEVHLQLAAGLQPLQSTAGLSGFLGALGLAPVAQTGLTVGSVAGSSVGVGAASAVGIGSGIAIGQTTIPIPVVGAVIGAIAFEAIHLAQRHVGKAEAAWANQAFYNSLRVMNGRDYDEHQFSEAFKGMMDTGNNIIPGCGPDRHKNPDCFLGPLAAVIAQGYLRQVVPLSATTRQVFQSVVVPWLQSGAGGMVNWSNLSKEPTQQLMIQAATDRYLADQAMTRGDMPSYGNQGAHTPTLLQALAPMLQQPTTTTPQVPGAVPAAPPTPAGQPTYVQPGVGQPIQAAQAPNVGTGYNYPTSPAQVPQIPVGSGGPATGYPTMSAPVSYAPAPVAMPAAPVATTSQPGGLSAIIPWGLVIAAGAAVLS